MSNVTADELSFTGRRPYYENKRPDVKVPKTAFDMEYSTQTFREYMFLKEHNIEPSFVKVDKTYAIKTYKYTKTPALFRLLVQYYEMVKNEKEYKQLEETVRKFGKPVPVDSEPAVMDALIENGAPLRKATIYA